MVIVVMDVGIVKMALSEIRRCSGQVGVMVLVVLVAMIVRETRVLVDMLVTLNHVQPHADGHENPPPTIRLDSGSPRMRTPATAPTRGAVE